MMGATPDMINKYIEENDLDESATRQLRSLPPHQQAVALRWDLSKYRNPSAKFMSMANGLGPSSMPTMPMGMPGDAHARHAAHGHARDAHGHAPAHGHDAGHARDAGHAGHATHGSPRRSTASGG